MNSGVVAMALALALNWSRTTSRPASRKGTIWVIWGNWPLTALSWMVCTSSRVRPKISTLSVRRDTLEPASGWMERRMMLVEPSCSTSRSVLRLPPSPMAIITITDKTPIMMPRVVRKEPQLVQENVGHAEAERCDEERKVHGSDCSKTGWGTLDMAFRGSR